MNQFKHTYLDIEKSTGLDPNFIRRIMREVPLLKKKNTENGSSGEILFDDNALIIFQHAAQMRANKRPFRLIAKTVYDAITPPLKPATNSSHNVDGKGQQNLISEMLSEIKRSHDIALKAKQETIEQLKQNILLLTHGKDPTQVYREREQEQAQLLDMEQRKNEAEKLAQDRAEKLAAQQQQIALELAKAEKLEHDLEQRQSETATWKQKLEAKQAEAQEREKQSREQILKRSELLDELTALSWFQWSRKRELVSQIKALD